MPLLGGLLGALLGGLSASWGDMITRKAVLVAASVALVVSITAGAVAAVTALCAGLVYAFPAVGLGVWLFVPDNASACVGVCLGCDATLAVAGWWRSNVRLGSQIAS